MAKSFKEDTAANRRISVSESRSFYTRHFGISIKIEPPSCDLDTEYQFMCEMHWLTVHLLYM